MGPRKMGPSMGSGRPPAVVKTSTQTAYSLTELNAVADYQRLQRRHPLRPLAIVGLLVAFVLVVRQFAQAQIDWNVVWNSLTLSVFAFGAIGTVVMTIATMTVATFVGIVSVSMGMSTNPILRVLNNFFLWFFRGMPVLLQLILWYNLALVLPEVGIGPWSWSTVDLMTPFIAGVLAFGIHEGAYVSEIIRAGLISVGRGQTDAALTLGMTKFELNRRVVYPQAMRVIIPPMGNLFIGVIKLTSLASVIAFHEILFAAENIYYQSNQVVELLIVAAVWYMALVTLLTVGQSYLEKRFSRGHAGSGKRRAPTWW